MPAPTGQSGPGQYNELDHLTKPEPTPIPEFLTRSKESLTGLEKADTVDTHAVTALDIQIDGNHYKELPIQPVEYIHANKIGYFEGNVIKYVSRWKTKNGVADLRKAAHYIQLLIELEEKANLL